VFYFTIPYEEQAMDSTTKEPKSKESRVKKDKQVRKLVLLVEDDEPKDILAIFVLV